MLIGYARVSTSDQSLDLQRDALRASGCERIFEDQITGASTARPGLGQLMGTLKAGDGLVVWKLDRLGRSLSHLVTLIDELGRSGIGFRSLSESIDTTTAAGRLVFHLMGSLAEFERALIAERTIAGVKAAQSRGVHCGRRPSMTPDQIRHARQALESGEPSRKVAAMFRVGKSTLYRSLAKHGGS